MNIETKIWLNSELQTQNKNIRVANADEWEEHIATCYNKGAKQVIQAGASVGIGSFKGAKKANVYLGYLLK